MTAGFSTHAVGFCPRAQTNAEALTGDVGKKRRQQNFTRNRQKNTRVGKNVGKNSFYPHRQNYGSGTCYHSAAESITFYPRAGIFLPASVKPSFCSASAAK